jgi:hypothetical protein
MLNQDINNQTDQTNGQTESLVKFIRVLKPTSDTHTAHGVASGTSEIETSIVASTTNKSSDRQNSTASDQIASRFKLESRTGTGCVPLKG